MQFSEVMGGIQVSNGQATLEVSAEWMQGRAVFGGLQSAIALRAMRDLVPETPLRSLQTTFVAPPASNQIRVCATIIRQGKSATHVEARLLEGESVLAIVIGVFGVIRESKIERIPVMPVVECESPRKFPYIEGKTPTFTQHFSARWLKGGMPFSGVKEPEIVVDIGMPNEGESSEYSVVAIADFIPPVALSYMQRPAPGSSMTWMLEFLTEDVSGHSMQGWRVDAEMVAGSNGYTNQSVMIWGPEGQPIALSRQTMVVFG